MPETPPERPVRSSPPDERTIASQLAAIDAGQQQIIGYLQSEAREVRALAAQLAAVAGLIALVGTMVYLLARDLDVPTFGKVTQ